MICQNCGKRQATVHIKTMVNGIYTEKHLCQECAKEYDSELDVLTPAGIISSMFGGEKPAPAKKCKNCGMTAREFTKTGYLGCSECYNEFKDVIAPVVKRVQGNTAHIGRIPTPVVTPKNEVERLRYEMEKAVKAEDYKRAAILRDKIREMEGKQNG